MRNVRHALLLAVPFALIVACDTGAGTGIEASDPAVPSCGGPGQPACPSTGCADDDDCEHGICGEDGQCQWADSGNGCGGATSPKCRDGEACEADVNCETGYCNAGVCTTPRGDDGVKNGDESDVDCGGTTTGAPRCDAGKTCNVDDDCASTGCAYQGVCVARPSCKVRDGGDTCGPGEPDGPNQHESCCTSLDLPMPGGAVQMDKYQITAGRFRVFLEAIDGNVRGWVTNNRPPGWDPTWDIYVPNGWGVDHSIQNDPEFLLRAASSVWHQLSGSALTNRLGRDGLPFQYGCTIQGNGTHTYWMPDAVQAELHDIPHNYPQEILDQKPITCVTSILLAAFCHWDWPGSRLPTYAETRYAWHKGEPQSYEFPWGNTPAPVGYHYPGAVFPDRMFAPEPTGRFGEFAVVPIKYEGMAGELDYANWKYNYAYPRTPFPAEMAPDQTAYISAPGRFPKGNGPFGHADLAGNLFDFTSDIAGQPGQHPDDREVTWGRNGAWEGHAIPFASENNPWTAPIPRKYGKTSGRCVR
jgi:formylglycine-generating enzyme required for sulfatase activity